MTDIRSRCREKQFRILCGIKDICDSTGIRLVLLRDAALAAYRGDLAVDYIDAGIEAADVSRFMKAFRDSGTDLVMDSVLDDPDFPIFELRIYDPSTLDLDLDTFRRRRYNCLHVVLHIIRHIPDSKVKRKVASSLENAYVTSSQIHTGEKSSSKGRMVKVMQRVEKIRGREKSAAGVFSTLLGSYSGSSDRLVIDGRKFKAKILGSFQEVVVNGVSLNIPGDPAGYFSALYGPEWKSYQIQEYRDSATRLRDPDHSWEEYSKQISHIDLEAYDRKRRRYKALSKPFSRYHKKVRAYRDILGRTDMRYHLWQQYMPEKDEIKELHGNGCYEELGNVLQEYIDALYVCMKQDLGLCFDEEILDIALDVIRHRGDVKAAGRMEELVPPEHREPIRIKNYRGEYIQKFEERHLI